jgi:hypothetical protein
MIQEDLDMKRHYATTAILFALSSSSALAADLPNHKRRLLPRLSPGPVFMLA